MLTVEEINGIAPLQSLQDAWRLLHDRTQDASLFQSPEWLEIYWRHCPGNQRLRLFVVHEKGDAIGIVPMVVRNVRTRMGLLRYLTYPLDEWGSTFAPIGPRPAETLAAAMKHVAETRRDWDVLEPRWVDEKDRAARHTEIAMQAAGFAPLRRRWLESPAIEFTGNFDDYLSSKNSRWRNNLKRNQRKLFEAGPIRHVRYRPLGDEHGDGDPNWELYDQCEWLARASWQGGSTNGTTLSHESVRLFLRAVHEAACRRGMVDVSLLYVADRPVAYWYCYCCRGRLYGLRTGYDSQSGFQRAGTVLTGRLVEDSFRRGDVLFDMGAGATEWKRFWQTTALPRYRYTYFSSRAMRAQILRASFWLKTGLKRLRARSAAQKPQAAM